ncbi:MAG: penicillin acylase family protein [Pseudomonadota bacterium]
MQKAFREKFHYFLLMLLLAAILASCFGGGGGSPVTTVETTRDDRGVWFISGTRDATMHNIFEAQGYAEATDRLWQAELYKRTSRGRLAEIFGTSQLPSDVLMRTTGYSEEELQAGFDALDQELRTIFQAYVDGFNRRIAEVTANSDLLPFEFKALGILPENWSVLDVLAWESVMLRNFDPEAGSQFQIQNMSLFATLAAQFPADAQAMFRDLRWTNDPEALTYYTAAAPKSRAITTDLPAASAIPDYSVLADTITQRYQEVEANLKEINAFVKMGSYAWVLAGSKTKSGNPIIYSGPQMGFPTPSIVLEGSIRAGNMDISGMSVPGLPGIIIGRTPHHAWSMQVANAHTTDYYLESPDNVTLHRMETIKVAGAADINLPVFRTAHGPVINPMPYNPALVSATNPVISWKYAHWRNEFNSIGGMIKLARAKSMDEFGAGIEDISVSQHFCYADKDGNIAYWMSGRDPVRGAGNWMLPQGFGGAPPLEWDADILKPRSTDRNALKGYYCGWNNKDSNLSESGMNAASKQFGPYDRAHVVDDYIKSHDNLTFEEVRDLIQNITTTDSFDSGGNPWKFVSPYFTDAVTAMGATAERQNALDILAAWDGHFVDGGAANWVAGADRADGWVLMDAWIREVIRLTFEDELPSLYAGQNKEILFNVILHGLKGAPSCIVNNYNWFQNLSDPGAPQTPDTIIVQALDTVLLTLNDRPWGKDKRGEISYIHDLIGTVHTMPFSSRSTYAHCVEIGANGPLRIESMFPLGESGTILMNTDGTPAFNDHFFSMTPLFDTMTHRNFPLFK